MVKAKLLPPFHLGSTLVGAVFPEGMAVYEYHDKIDSKVRRMYLFRRHEAGKWMIIRGAATNATEKSACYPPV